MRELITTMTERGQVTVPAEVRRLLGLTPRGKVAFAIEDGQVRILPVELTFEETYSSVEPLSDGDFEEQIRAAKRDHAVGVVRKLETP